MGKNAILDRLRAERDEARDSAIQLAEAEDFDPTAESFVELEKRAASLDSQIERLVGILEQRASADAIDARIGRISERRNREETTQTTESTGTRFIRSAVYGEYPFRGSSQRFDFEFSIEKRAPLTLADVGDVLTHTARVIETAGAPNTFLAQATVIPVSTNGVEIIAYELTNNAAVVPEGQAKPESTLTPVVTPLSLKTIAHWTQFTRQLAEDAAAVRSRIDSEMIRGVRDKMNADALATFLAGTYPNVTYGGTGAPQENLQHGIRRGWGEVQANGYSANTVFLNPDDWAALDLDILNSTGVPNVGQNFWGLTPIADPTIPAGTAFVSDLRATFEYYLRNNAQLYLTDSHASTFISNILTLLAEGRGGGAVIRPNATAEVVQGVIA